MKRFEGWRANKFSMFLAIILLVVLNIILFRFQCPQRALSVEQTFEGRKEGKKIAILVPLFRNGYPEWMNITLKTLSYSKMFELVIFTDTKLPKMPFNKNLRVVYVENLMEMMIEKVLVLCKVHSEGLFQWLRKKWSKNLSFITMYARKNYFNFFH